MCVCVPAMNRSAASGAHGQFIWNNTRKPYERCVVYIYFNERRLGRFGRARLSVSL